MKCYCDLHIHSALSPCADKDMTPNNIVNMSVLCGLQMIALTDHNTIGNVEAAMKAAEELPLTVVPGMELETMEEIHFVCLFPTLEIAKEFDAWLAPYRMHIKNKPEIFGEQFYMNEKDEVVGTEEYLLVTATTCSIYDAAPKVRTLGGVIYPAHVDRSSYSVISNFGTVPEDLKFTSVEISAKITKEEALEKYPYLSKYQIVTDSDSHYLDTFYDTQNPIELPEISAEALIAKLAEPIKK